MSEAKTLQNDEHRREKLLELIRMGTEAEPIYREYYQRHYGEVPDE